MHRMERYHYAAPLIPIIVTAGIFGTDWLSRTLARKDERRRAVSVRVLAVLVVICSLWYHYYRGFTPLARAFSWPEVTAHHRMIDRVTAHVPDDAVVSAQANLFPHVSQRERGLPVAGLARQGICRAGRLRCPRSGTGTALRRN